MHTVQEHALNFARTSFLHVLLCTSLLLITFVNPRSPKSAGVQSIEKETFGSKVKSWLMSAMSLQIASKPRAHSSPLPPPRTVTITAFRRQLNIDTTSSTALRLTVGHSFNAGDIRHCQRLDPTRDPTRRHLATWREITTINLRMRPLLRRSKLTKIISPHKPHPELCSGLQHGFTSCTSWGHLYARVSEAPWLPGVPEMSTVSRNYL